MNYFILFSLFMVSINNCLCSFDYYNDDNYYYDYEYDDYEDLENWHQEKWHQHKTQHGKYWSRTDNLNLHDQYERYTKFKENLLTIQDHNQAYENGSVTFSQKENHFSHLTFDEFHEHFLTPLQMMEPPKRAGSSLNKKEKLHRSFKPIRTAKHRVALAKNSSDPKFKRQIEDETDTDAFDDHTDDYNQTTTLIENTSEKSPHKKFHHVNKFKQSRYARLALQMKKSVEKNNGGIFTLKAKAKVTTTVVVDWNARGFVTPVIDQGTCGSCYAYSTAGALESLIAIRAKSRLQLKSLSKQQILDCSNDGNSNAGCNGGDIRATYEYIKANGLQLESVYPYQSRYWVENPKQIDGYSGPCRYVRSRVSLKTVKRIVDIATRNVTTMIQVLKNQPISAYIYVMDDFFQYHSGIYTNDECSADCSAPNHAVLITGYATTSDGLSYWIAKNTWTTAWGEKGYFRIEAGKNMCCIEQANTYATL